MLPTIQRIKRETNLIIKLHTGLVDKTLAESIVHAGVDIASIEVVGDTSSIHDIFSLDATPHTYQQSLLALHTAGMPFIVPHVCIGLNYGKLQGEIAALQLIKKSCSPSTIVFIVFRPTKGTPLAHTPPPTKEDVHAVISTAKTMFPGTDLALGCIRPRARYRTEIEHAAVDAGVTRMELPSKSTLELVKQQGYHVKTIDTCCALPRELEPIIEDRLLDTHSHA
jgi:uncharacterized radical SAM superfamily protein